MLHDLGNVLVALSGGVDSATLLAIAAGHAGVQVQAATGLSKSLANRELADATQVCQAWRVPHYRLDTDELAQVAYRRNEPDRCFHCKNELYGQLRRLADRLGIEHIVDGTTAEDLGGHRPGHAAAQQHRIHSPWVSVGANKNDIRAIARELGVDVADKPSSPCLSSRIAYGTEVTAERLDRVGQAEGFLRDLGFNRLRVRLHGPIARIEVPPTDFDAVCVRAADIRARLQQLGFTYITLDLGGLRSGSLLEVLPSAANNPHERS